MFRSLSIMLLLATFLACASQGWNRSGTVLQTTNVVVELEQYTKKGVPNELNAHPAEIDEERLIIALGEIGHRSVSLFGEGKAKPALGKESLNVLAKAVGEGLVRAQASERIRFEVRSASSLLFLHIGNTVTNGVVFVSPAGVLNIAFDEIRVPADTEGMDADGDSWGDPTRSSNSGGRLELPDYARLGRDQDGKAVSLWAAMDIDKIRRAPVVQGSAPGSDSKLPESGSRMPESPVLSETEILAQLRLLEELYQQGSLPEAQYKIKRAELLRPRH